MSTRLPALSLAAVPGRRQTIIDLAKAIEAKGFPGIYGPSLGDSLALCQAIAMVTERVRIGTSITPIYTRHPTDFASTVGFIHEVSGGRFHFGIGVSHAPAMDRLGVKQGKPLADIRQFVADLKATPRVGELPPIVLATLRRKMIALAGEIGDGMVFANGSRSHMATSLAALPAAARDNPDFFIGDMIPTCIHDDIDRARAVNRRTLTGYAMLPNYRNYWREAGYAEEMDAVEAAIANGDKEGIGKALTDRWLDDCTLAGPASRVREGIEAWFDAGIRTPIIVPSSAEGNQLTAFEEFFAIWD